MLRELCKVSECFPGNISAYYCVITRISVKWDSFSDTNILFHLLYLAHLQYAARTGFSS
jgi:hypothetical protein